MEITLSLSDFLTLLNDASERAKQAVVGMLRFPGGEEGLEARIDVILLLDTTGNSITAKTVKNVFGANDEEIQVESEKVLRALMEAIDTVLELRGIALPENLAPTISVEEINNSPENIRTITFQIFVLEMFRAVAEVIGPNELEIE